MHKISALILLAIIQISAFHAMQVNASRQVRNLTAFSKLYGYVRHFHPTDEAQEIEWDKFAAYGSEQVKNAQNDKELINTLNDLFTPVAPTLKLYTSKQDRKFDLSVLIPSDTTDYCHTCWQYKGYKNKPKSFYQSFRTYRPFKIEKTPAARYVAAFISLIIDKPDKATTALRLSFSARKAIPDTLQNEIYGVCSHDYRPDSLSTNSWEHKSYTFDNIDSSDSRIWIYLGGFTKVLIDSIVCEALVGHEWKQVYNNDFSTSKPGFMPIGMNINLSPFFSQAPNNDISVETINSNNVLSIQKSTTDLPFTQGYMTKLFEEEASYTEVIDKPLVKGISCLLPLSLYCNQTQTYPPSDTLKLNILKGKLAAINTHDRTNHNNYLAALMIYWNELQHFFPYWQYANTDWSKDFNKALRQTLKCDNIKDFVLIMCELASQTHDSHATFYDDKTDRKAPPFNAEPFNGKWIVTGVANDSLNIPLGSEVKLLNGKSFTGEINKYRRYYVSGTKQHTDKYLFSRIMRTYQDSAGTFTFVTPDRKKVTKMFQYGMYNVDDWYNRTGKVTRYSEDIYYVNLGMKGVNSAELDSLLSELTTAKGIVFDLRDYPQRTNLLNYLLTKPDTLANHNTKLSIYPDSQFLPDRAMTSDNWNLQPQEPHIAAKAVFLCGGYSVSFCESVLMEIKYNKLGTIIGQPTAGVTGNVVTGNYPCDLVGWWTGMFIRNPDGSRFHGVGIIPDIIVPRTVKAVVEGKDAELDTALKYLQSELELKYLPVVQP